MRLGKAVLNNYQPQQGRETLGAGEAWARLYLPPDFHLFPTVPKPKPPPALRIGPDLSKRMVATSFPQLPSQHISDERSDHFHPFNASL